MNNSRRVIDEGVSGIVLLLALVVYWRIRGHLAQLGLYVLLLLVGALSLGLFIHFKHRGEKELKPRLWEGMDGREFEDQVVVWLKSCGYTEVVKTEYFDYGIDIIAAKPGQVLGVQVKRSARPVGVSAVRAAVSGLKHYGCTQAMVVTNSSFTRAAIELAEDNDCRLIDGTEMQA